MIGREEASIRADFDALAAYLAERPALPEESDQELADRLYAAWYLGLRAPASRDGPPLATEVDLAAACDAAHAATDRLVAGWRAVRVSTQGRAVATDGTETRIVGLGDYVDLDRLGRRAEPGDALMVTARRSVIEDGFWVARSAAWAPIAAEPIVRLYLAARLRTVSDVVARLSAVLDAWGGPHAIKVFLGLAEVQRPDALVAFLPTGAFDVLRPEMAGMVSALRAADDLEPDRPRLTLTLAPGVSVAEGAGDGASFGGDRCRLIAGAARGPTEGLPTRIAAAFDQAGLDPRRPWLAGGAARAYGLL